MESESADGASSLSREMPATAVIEQLQCCIRFTNLSFPVHRIIDKIPQRSSGFHISDILQLNNNNNETSTSDVIKTSRSPMDYSMYPPYNDYQTRQSYYSAYHPQILPSTLSSFESDLPFYNTTFGPTNVPPSTYGGSVYFPSDPTMTSNAYASSQMLSNRFLINDANNNSFGELL